MWEPSLLGRFRRVLRNSTYALRAGDLDRIVIEVQQQADVWVRADTARQLPSGAAELDLRAARYGTQTVLALFPPPRAARKRS